MSKHFRIFVIIVFFVISDLGAQSSIVPGQKTLGSGVNSELSNQSASANLSFPDGSTNLETQLSPLEEMYSSMAGEVLRIIGRDQVRRQSLFKPIMGSASYRLGPGDKVMIFLWGESIDFARAESTSFPTSFESLVAVDGALNILSLGRYPVQGLTLFEAKELMRTDLSKRFRRFDLSITITQPRQQIVWVTGFVQTPGQTAVPPGASVLEALAAAGGVVSGGTLRKIEIWASGKQRSVDLYPLLFGNSTTDLVVADGDRIVVGPMGPTVGISGGVFRPGIYEFLEAPRWDEVKKWAGGIEVFADEKNLRLYRLGEDGIAINSGVETILSGDFISVPQKTFTLKDRISVHGSVRISGDQNIEDCPDLKSLLVKVVLLANHNPYYGEIKRLVSPGKPEFLTFQPRKVLDNKQNIELKAGDEIRLYAIDEEITDRIAAGYEQAITLSGNTRYRGPVAFFDQYNLTDLLKDFELLPDSDRLFVDVRRSEAPDYQVQAFSPNLESLRSGGEDFLLKPGDTITFLPKRLQDGVRVIGLIKKPKWIDFSPEMSLLDLLKGVEFLLPMEHLQVMILTENEVENAAFPPVNGVLPNSKEASKEIPKEIKLVQSLPENNIPAYPSAPEPKGRIISLKKVFMSPQEEFIEKIKPGDVILINEIPYEMRRPKVTISGAIVSPGVYYLQNGERLSDIITKAGGYKARAFPEGLVLLRESIKKSQSKLIDISIRTLRQKLTESNELVAENQISKDSKVLSGIAVQLAHQQEQLKELEGQKSQVLGRLSISHPETFEQLLSDQVQNIFLEENDYIFIPEVPQYVLVLGETYNPVSVPYNPGQDVASYLSQTGGATATGDLEEIYIIKASGKILSPRTRPWFLWFKPNLMNEILGPGDAIVIPPKPPAVTDWLTPVRDVTTILSQVTSTTISALALFKTLSQ